MDYYQSIKNKLIENEIYSKVKDYSKEKNKVMTYFEIGKLLTEAGGKYGDRVIEDYSNKLMNEVGKKYNKRTLFRMRQFYNLFSNEKVSPLVTQLTWTHYIVLLALKDYDEIVYYIEQCIKLNLSKRELQEKIKSKEYERLDDKTRKKIINNKEMVIQDYIKHPIIIKNNKNYDDISEKALEQLILEDIDSFLKELGDGFTYVGHQYKIKVGNTFNYIDLLLFNIKYNCYCVVELKVTQLKKEHIGQIMVYMNYIDSEVKLIYHNKTIGIIVCRENNEYVVKYCSNSNIFQTTYLFSNEEENFMNSTL